MMLRLALAAAAAGSAVGAVVVLADEPVRAPAVPVVAVATPAPTAAPAVARASAERIIARAADPDGGQPWAIRRFRLADRRRPSTCVDIGRLDGERFGWVDTRGRFAPVRAGSFKLFGACHTAAHLRKVGASLGSFTTLSMPPAGTPQPKVSVTWAMAPDSVRAVVPDGGAALELNASGVALQVRPGEAGEQPLRGHLEHRDGTRTPFDSLPVPPGFRGEDAVPGTGFVAARMPDPAGGQPWGLMASRGARGGVCLSLPGTLIGTRLGTVVRRLGIFLPLGLETMIVCPPRRGTPTKANPLRISTTTWGTELQDPRGRIERRMLGTRIVFHGRVHRDVASVTIRTPRDVRTLVPSSDVHAILAVYDGHFPGGEVTATARMKDGREMTRALHVK
jgi:hypothetical protein